MLILAVLDQLTKSWAFTALPAKGDTRSVLPPIFSLTHSENPGIIMGVGGGVGWIFTLTSFVMLAVLLAILWRKTLPWTWRLALAAIASGALGNGLDRLQLGYVRDFLDVHYYGFSNPRFNFTYPTFNMADSCICVGAAILALGLWKAPSPTKAPDHA